MMCFTKGEYKPRKWKVWDPRNRKYNGWEVKVNPKISAMK